MLTMPAALAPFIRADSRRLRWWLRITKSEGTTDPDSGSDPWPGTGDGQTKRVFTTGEISWSTAATMRAQLVLHEGRLNAASIKDIVHKLDRADRDPGGLASVESFEVELINTDGGIRGVNPAAAFVDVRFEGRKVEFGLSAYGAEDDAGLVLFTGRVNDVLPGDMLRIICDGVLLPNDPQLPARLIRTGEGTPVNRAAEGKPLPMVYGAHEMAPGFVTENSYTTDGDADVGRRVRFCDMQDQEGGALAIGGISGLRFGHADLIEATAGLADVKVDAAPGGLTTVSAYTIDDAAAAVYFTDRQAELLYLYLDIVPTSTCSSVYFAMPATDAGKAIDRSEDTFAEFENTQNPNGGLPDIGCTAAYKLPVINLAGTIERNGTSWGMFFLERSDIDLPDGIGFSKQWFCRISDRNSSLVNIGDAEPGKILAYGVVDEERDTLSPPVLSTDNQLEQYTGTYADFDDLSDLGRYYLNLVNSRAETDGPLTSNVLLYEMALRVYCYIEFPGEGYLANMEGYADDGSGTITGTASALIANPAHIAAHLMRYFAPDGADVIDIIGARAVADDQRDGWLFARAIVEREKLSEILGTLGSEALLWFWTDEAGQLQVTPWDNGIPALALTDVDCERGELDNFGTSRLDELCTEFELKWRYNPIRDDYDESLTCSATSSSAGLGATYEDLCAWASYRNGGVSRKKTIELQWVRDRTTAVAILQKIIRFHAARRWWIRWTSDVVQVKYQIGDLVDPSGGSWPAHYEPEMTTARYRIVERRIRPSKKGAITFKAAQVFE